MSNNIFQEYGNSPIALFQSWLAEAEKAEPNDPNAMALATVDRDGRPQVRMVLLKDCGADGLSFFTNQRSAKADDLAHCPYAALNFHWKSLGRQVRISGPVMDAGANASDAYFASRRRESRIGAWASDQSRTLASYQDFEKRIAAFQQQFEGQDVPRPPHWGGYRVVPERMEFWIGHPDRLHKRFVYVRESDEWRASWLFP